MREILFRGKRIDNDEWVYGYYARKGADKESFRHYICVSTFSSDYQSNYTYPFYLYDYEVDPLTVGQCVSGLTDKNGKKIFEGDIVHYQCSDVIAEVKIGEYRDTESHKDAYGCYVEFVEDDQIVQEVMNHMESNETYGCEVICNIHDNSELLEDKL